METEVVGKTGVSPCPEVITSEASISEESTMEASTLEVSRREASIPVPSIHDVNTRGLLPSLEEIMADEKQKEKCIGQLTCLENMVGATRRIWRCEVRVVGDTRLTRNHVVITACGSTHSHIDPESTRSAVRLALILIVAATYMRHMPQSVASGTWRT